ncbi:hypothetical protein N9468_04635, partial [Flavobacteriaceae bacterium]|nr:hypothetical protein [Flavobacteriaceae bacterium]
MAEVRSNTFGSNVRLSVPGPSGRLRDHSSPDAFGASAAGAIGKFGATLHDISTDYLTKREEAVASESYFNAVNEANELYFRSGGDGIRDTTEPGILATKGSGSFGSHEKATVELRRLREHHTKGLKSKVARDKFGRMWEAHEAGLLKQASVHEATETYRYRVNTLQAGMQTLSHEAQSYFNRPEMIGQLYEQ